jgi:hypothetical protein
MRKHNSNKLYRKTISPTAPDFMSIIALKTTASSTQLNAKPSKTSLDPEPAAADVKCRLNSSGENLAV